MLKTPALAMPRTRKITTVCNGKREVWTDYEQAKAYFLEVMMSTDGEEHDRAECVYIQGNTAQLPNEQKYDIIDIWKDK